MMKRLFKKLRGKKGEMLIETIIGAALLTLLMAALVTMLMSATSYSRDAFFLNKHNNDNTKALDGGGMSDVVTSTTYAYFSFSYEVPDESGVMSTYNYTVSGQNVVAIENKDNNRLFMFVPEP